MPAGATSSNAITLSPVCWFSNLSAAVLPGAMFQTGSCPGNVTKLFVSIVLFLRRLLKLARASCIFQRSAECAAVGVDERGDEHVLGWHEGATENAVVCQALRSCPMGRIVRHRV